MMPQSTREILTTSNKREKYLAEVESSAFVICGTIQNLSTELRELGHLVKYSERR